MVDDEGSRQQIPSEAPSMEMKMRKISDMKSNLLATVAIFGIVIPLIAHAYPQTRVINNPSSILIYASNSEDRSYSCTINMVWSHSIFGERKSETMSTTAGVSAHAKDALIMNLSGALVDVKIESGPNINCT